MPKRPSSNRNHNSNALRFERLEDRKYLAATVYVDFGLSADDFTVNDTDVAALNGPAIFGDSYQLKSFATSVEEAGIDFNFDREVNAEDQTAFIDSVMSTLDQMFAPFDVTVEQVSSANFQEISNRLSVSDTNDAYIFVGGQSPVALSEFEFGEALIDTGNQSDNIGFIFADDIFSSVVSTQPASIESALFSSLILSGVFSRMIAKQAGHTFGLQSTNQVETFGEFYSNKSIMSEIGTNQDGIPYESPDERELYRSTFFSRELINLTDVNGVSAGTENSFETLMTTVGLKNDSPYYFNVGTFAKTFTVSETETGISIALPNAIGTIEIPADELENGLTISGAFDVTMGQLSQYQVHVQDVGIFTVDPSLDLNAGPNDLPRNSWYARVTVEPVVTERYLGRVNENISYSTGNNGRLTLQGGDGVDHFIFPELERNEIVAEESLQNMMGDFELYDTSDSVKGQGGDDVFEFYRQVSQAEGGTGNDAFIGPDSAYLVRGNEGFDVREFAGLSMQIEALPSGFGTEGFNGAHGFSGIERSIFFDSSPEAIRSVSIDSDQTIDIIIDGDVSLLVDKTNGTQHEVHSANQFIFTGLSPFSSNPDASDPNRQGNFWVRSTTRPLNIQGGSYIQFSSEFDRNTGNLNSISHDVSLSYGIIANTTPIVVISDKSGDGIQNGMLTRDFLATNGNRINFLNEFAPTVYVEGSDSAPDYFAIASTLGSTSFNGNGGDDFVTVGFPYGGPTGAQPASLNFIKGLVILDAGAGNDLVKVEDRTFAEIDILNKYVTTGIGYGQPNTFGSLFYNNVEALRVDTNWHYTIPFTQTVWPSANTFYQINVFAIRGDSTPKPDTLELIGINGDPNDGRTFSVIDSINDGTPDSKRSQAWFFAGGLDAIRIERVDTIQN